MNLNQSTFTTLRALQSEMGALAETEAERTTALTEASAKVEQLGNRLVQALSDVHSNWASVDALQRDLLNAQMLVVSLLSQENPTSAAKVEEMRLEISSQVNQLAGRPDPNAGPVLSAVPVNVAPLGPTITYLNVAPPAPITDPTGGVPA